MKIWVESEHGLWFVPLEDALRAVGGEGGAGVGLLNRLKVQLQRVSQGTDPRGMRAIARQMLIVVERHIAAAGKVEPAAETRDDMLELVRERLRKVSGSGDPWFAKAACDDLLDLIEVWHPPEPAGEVRAAEAVMAANAADAEKPAPVLAEVKPAPEGPSLLSRAINDAAAAWKLLGEVEDILHEAVRYDDLHECRAGAKKALGRLIDERRKRQEQDAGAKSIGFDRFGRYSGRTPREVFGVGDDAARVERTPSLQADIESALGLISRVEWHLRKSTAENSDPWAHSRAASRAVQMIGDWRLAEHEKAKNSGDAAAAEVKDHHMFPLPAMIALMATFASRFTHVIEFLKIGNIANAEKICVEGREYARAWRERFKTQAFFGTPAAPRPAIRYDYIPVFERVSENYDTHFVVRFPQLPGCMEDGPTMYDAWCAGQDAIDAWIETAKAEGREIPEEWSPIPALKGSRISGAEAEVYLQEVSNRVLLSALKEAHDRAEAVLSKIRDGDYDNALTVCELLLRSLQQNMSAVADGKTIAEAAAAPAVDAVPRAEHEKRVSQLLEANNREVKRRREVEFRFENAEPTGGLVKRLYGTARNIGEDTPVGKLLSEAGQAIDRM